MCAFANLGGPSGKKLARAAFAVILKFSDGIPAFSKLIADIEIAMEDVATSAGSD